MVFDVMNLKNSLTKFNHNDLSVEQIVKRYNEIQPFLNGAILRSDGSMIKGNNPFLFTKKGFFDISDELDANKRFYWDDEKNSYPYFFKNKKLFVGYLYVDNSHVSPFNCLFSPLLSLKGLYKNHNVDEFTLLDFLGSFKIEDNIDEKIDFLENFLEESDESGYTHKDMLVKNKNLRLKLLEKNYEREIEFYSNFNI